MTRVSVEFFVVVKATIDDFIYTYLFTMPACEFLLLLVIDAYLQTDVETFFSLVYLCFGQNPLLMPICFSSLSMHVLITWFIYESWLLTGN
jgi:hypothetical protein